MDINTINVARLDDPSRLASVTLGPDSKIYDAIENLEQSGLQIVIIADEDQTLIGIITDGDIRRGILRGTTLEKNVTEVMVRAPKTLHKKSVNKEAEKLMIAHKLSHVPIVDEGNRIVDLFIIAKDTSPKLLKNTFLIMAGGFGKRMFPLTENCPKPMLKVDGKPILEHVIERAKSQGFVNFTISLHYLPDVIRDYFKDGSEWCVNIKYVQEENPLGTAGALSLITEEQNLPIVVTNGDVLNDLNYSDLIEFHNSKPATATMVVRKHEIQNPFGVVQTDGMYITKLEEKPTYTSLINAGIYVLSHEALNFVPQNTTLNMPDLFDILRFEGKNTIVYPIHETWYDVGRPADISIATKYIKSSRYEK